MGTLTRILIKGLNKDTIAELISNSYSIGRSTILDSSRREVFFEKMNYAFIIFDAYLEDWTDIVFDFNKTIEEHDTFLFRISKDFKTTVLFGYEQTTSGDTRFLVVENGEIVRLIHQKAYYDPDRFIMEENFGEKLQFEKSFSYPEVGQDLENYKFLDFYDLQEMFVDAGYKGKSRTITDEKYLHLEYLK
jgi:hypothetical protein